MARAARKPTAPIAWRFPERLVRQGTRLLTQQCWYWGCDVRRPEGNLLLEHGFARARPPAGAEGSTLYSLVPNPGAQLVFWSFGVFYGCAEGGGLFLNRFRCDPQLCALPALPATIWRIEQLPALHRPGLDDRARLSALLDGLIAWTIRYEQRILATQSAAYRQACLAQWSRERLALPADQMVSGWATLADVIAEALSV